jgi:hypothetical protein
MAHQKKPPLSRREWARLSSAGVLGAAQSGWFESLAAQAAGADETRSGSPADTSVLRKPKSCILLWMDGGPSHIDTFDPKPEAGSDVRGELGAIDTDVPGIRIAEKFPLTSRIMKHAAVLRGMSTEEADHERARIYMHTGYKPGFGGVSYPPLGAIASAELGDPGFSLPNFIVTGSPLNKHDFLTSAGYLGPRHQALVHADPSRPPANLAPPAAAGDFDRRAAVLERLEADFRGAYRAEAAEAHRATFARAVRMMRSEHCRAFDLAAEPEKVRAAYGEGRFGGGCLLARRLVETGVRFVEVYLENWDTHEKKSADKALELMPQVDRGMSALVTDLAQRGMLDDTLLVWMGEFGRTPRINRNGGRDHYATAWTSVLLGGGLKGGQVIGKTDDGGARVTDRPINAKNFLATLAKTLGIDYAKTVNAPGGRPIRLVDTGAEPIGELFG